MISLSELRKPLTQGKALVILNGKREAIADFCVLFFILVFLLSYFEPKYLFSTTITTGGDTASHYYTAQYLRDHLLPQGRISGWTQGNYAGFPILQFYFPLPFLLMVILSYLIPLQVSFKLVSVLGIFLLPFCTYFALRLMRYRFPAPAMGAVFTLPFLFMEANSMWGGNIPSTLAGEFAYSWGFAFTILFSGSLYSGVIERKHLFRNALLVFLIGFSHGYTLLFAGLAASFFLWTTEDFLKRFWYLFRVFFLGFLFLGFWIIPLLAYLPFTTAYNFLWIFESIFEVFPKFLFPLLSLALVGIGLEAYRFFKSREIDGGFWYFSYWILISTLSFFSAYRLGIVDIRFLPFLQFSLILLGALGLYKLTQKTQGQIFLVGLVLVGVTSWTAYNVESIPTWIAWNYSGFEGKSLWPQFSQVNERLKGAPSDPRIFFEHSDSHNAAGTTRAFESLPLFSGRSTLEGLYMQASTSAPFVFYIQSEVSDQISCPFPNYACSQHNIDRGMKHLEMFNVRDLVVISERLKSELKAHPKFRLKESVPPYEVYELTTNENRYVVPLKYEPVFLQTRDWKGASYQWFKDFRNNDVHLVFPVGTDPSDLNRFKTVLQEKGEGDLPKIAVEATGEVRERVRDDEILIETSRIGQPHLVKVSYHPNWKVEGADKIFLASPSFMLIYPTRSHVRLYYGRSRPELLGKTSTFLGLATFLFKLPFVRRSFSNRASIASDRRPRFELPAFLKNNGFSQALSAKKSALLAGGAILFFSSLFGFLFLNKAEDPQSLLRDGILLKDLKNYPKSRERFQSILERFPTAGVADQAGYYYAITYYLENRCEETIAGFEDLIKKYSESVWIPEAYYHIGLCNERLDRISEAENNFKYVIDQFPATLWAGRAREKLAQPPVVETGALFGQAIAYFNKDQCKEVKALVHRLRTEQPDFGEMDQALALDAICFYKEGDYEETINRFRGLAEKYPKSRLAPEAYYHIALSNQYLQRRDEAKRNYERVVKRFPETEWARHSSEALKNLK
jgi:TolA-binding protein